MTAIYATCLSIGTSLSAGLTVPIGHVGGSWRVGLGIWSAARRRGRSRSSSGRCARSLTSVSADGALHDRPRDLAGDCRCDGRRHDRRQHSRCQAYPKSPASQTPYRDHRALLMLCRGVRGARRRPGRRRVDVDRAVRNGHRPVPAQPDDDRHGGTEPRNHPRNLCVRAINRISHRRRRTDRCCSELHAAQPTDGPRRLRCSGSLSSSPPSPDGLRPGPGSPTTRSQPLHDRSRWHSEASSLAGRRPRATTREAETPSGSPRAARSFDALPARTTAYDQWRPIS